MIYGQCVENMTAREAMENQPEVVHVIEELRCCLNRNFTLINAIKDRVINPNTPKEEEPYGNIGSPVTLKEILQGYVFSIDNANADLERINSILEEAFGGQIFLK